MDLATCIDIMMMELYLPIFQPYATPFPGRTESDLSMVTPIYAIKLNPLEVTPPHVIHLDSKATSSMRGSHVSGRGRGCGDGLRGGTSGCGNGYVSS